MPLRSLTSAEEEMVEDAYELGSRVVPVIVADSKRWTTYLCVIDSDKIAGTSWKDWPGLVALGRIFAILNDAQRHLFTRRHILRVSHLRPIAVTSGFGIV